jgi:hypothetical protein
MREDVTCRSRMLSSGLRFAPVFPTDTRFRREEDAVNDFRAVHMWTENIEIERVATNDAEDPVEAVPPGATPPPNITASIGPTAYGRARRACLATPFASFKSR